MRLQSSSVVMSRTFQELSQTLKSAHLEAIDSLRKAVRASPGEVYERSEQRPDQKQNV